MQVIISMIGPEGAVGKTLHYLQAYASNVSFITQCYHQYK